MNSFTEEKQGKVAGDQHQSVCFGPECDSFLGTTTSLWPTCFSSDYVALSLSCKNQHLWRIVTSPSTCTKLHLHEIISAEDVSLKPPW